MVDNVILMLSLFGSCVGCMVYSDCVHGFVSTWGDSISSALRRRWRLNGTCKVCICANVCVKSVLNTVCEVMRNNKKRMNKEKMWMTRSINFQFEWLGQHQHPVIGVMRISKWASRFKTTYLFRRKCMCKTNIIGYVLYVICNHNWFFYIC